MTQPPTPARKSIRERMAALKTAANPLIQTDLNLLDEGETTATFSVGSTGELVVDAAAPLPVTVERAHPHGCIETSMGGAYHLLLVPQAVAPEEIEALAVSVWGEAGWLAPGVLRLQENVTLEGPWKVDETTAAELGIPSDNRQAWLLRCAPQRGAAPSPEVQQFDAWARAFPEGMPVGIERKVLDVMRRIARRLRGSVRVAGTGSIVRAEVDASLTLRVVTDQWLSPSEMWDLLSPFIEGLTFSPQPGPDGTLTTGVPFAEPGMPYALLAPVSPDSQVLIGVRRETFVPRALRWERWAKGPLFVAEIVWVAPEELGGGTSRLPSRRARLERNRATQIAETAAAVIATHARRCAVLDEDGFLLAVDETKAAASPPPGESR